MTIGPIYRYHHNHQHNDKSMEWIKSEDRLPKIWEHVIIYSPGDKPGEGYRVTTDAYENDGWWRYISDDNRGSQHFSNDDVTHWMPLPKPPKT